MRAQPVWSLLGQLGHPVGVVGYWNTWPAYEVNGFLVSSHMGVRGKRQGIDTQLTWPPELVDDVQALAPDEAAMERLTRELYPASCTPLEAKSLASFERILWQDAFYFRIARNLLPTMEHGFFTVYFESVDASGHLFLPLSYGAELAPGCPESVREVVDKTYMQIDKWGGRARARASRARDRDARLRSRHGTGRRSRTACALRRLPRSRRRFSSRWANARSDDSRCRAHGVARARRAGSSRHGRQSGRVELRGRVARSKSSPLCRRGYVAPPPHRSDGRGLGRNARATTVSRLPGVANPSPPLGERLL